MLDDSTDIALGFYLSCEGNSLVVLFSQTMQAFILLEEYLEHGKQKYFPVSHIRCA
ncbi:hypothetical protein [Bartonella koehlerae]|uniref:hypothetical protein n=1 Tax=Bartonella koehlerae TaxID=92181 RepID=UPI000AB6A034|nr:hypothetical protein [Bartonella koehlerae]